MSPAVRRLPLVVAATLLVVRPAGAQHEHHEHEGAREPIRIGAVSFPSSASPAARTPFLRGIALLHSFEYDEAAAAFRAAQKADSGFALAYWEEALTYAKLLWAIDEPAKARQALARLAPTREERLAAARTPRERAYGAAVEALYADTTLAARTGAYADSMRVVVKRYPADLEAKAFAAVALLVAIENDGIPAHRQAAAREEAITLAQTVFDANPRHPGAPHYLIHATDDPRFARRGLAAARAYAKIAPDAEHALHMPSHIFLQLGLWDDVAHSNERAWAASRAWVAGKGYGPEELDFHGFGWLAYAYLQQGRWHAARALIDTVQTVLRGADLSAPGDADARIAASNVSFYYARETGRWSDVVAPVAASGPPSSQRDMNFRAAGAYRLAAVAMMRGDTSDAPVRSYAAFRDSLPAPFQRATAPVAVQLDALAAIQRGDRARAITLLQSITPPDRDEPPVGPPAMLSSLELLGGLLLQENRPADAAAIYRRLLAMMPGKSSALLGLARAQAAAGDRAGAAATYRTLLANWRNADPDLPALAEVRAGARAARTASR